MVETKPKKSTKKAGEISPILFTIFMAVAAFLLYFFEFIGQDEQVRKQLESLLAEVHINVEQQTVFLIVVAFVGALMLLLISFLVYKVICKLCSCKIADKKLFMAVCSGCALCFSLGFCLIGHLPFMAIALIGNAVELVMVLSMCFAEMKKKIVPIVLLRVLISGINLLMIT